MSYRYQSYHAIRIICLHSNTHSRRIFLPRALNIHTCKRFHLRYIFHCIDKDWKHIRLHLKENEPMQQFIHSTKMSTLHWNEIDTPFPSPFCLCFKTSLKVSLICVKMDVTCKTHLHIIGFAPGLVLKQRQKENGLFLSPFNPPREIF